MTKIYVAIEQHFVEYRGAIYTDIAFAYPYWQEYLEVFDKICPIARVRKLTTLSEEWQRADGPNVCFIPITEYRGFWDFLKKAIKTLYDCYKATREEACYLLRMGNISTFCWFWLLLKRKPYAYEVVGHAGESVLMVKNVQKFGLARMIAFVNHKLTGIQARLAGCCSYTSKYVQGLYPSSNKENEWIFSGVKLDEEVITAPKTAKQFQGKSFHIVSVGRLEPEKGHLVLVEAIEQLIQRGHDLCATIIGPGREIDNLQSYVEKMGLNGKVNICGVIPWGRELFAKFDEANLFILPSFSEGMPRALIEAMARGLPAIGSDVGGIKELLSEEYRVPPHNSEALADKIVGIIDDAERLEMMSRANFAKAMEYRAEIMNRRKRDFWQCIKEHSC